MDHFDLPSLVQTIAQKNGWRETAIPVGIGEEEIVLKKSDEVIKPRILGDQILYQAGDQRIQAKQRFADNNELFEQVNRILVQLFKLEPYEIRIAVE